MEKIGETRSHYESHRTVEPIPLETTNNIESQLQILKTYINGAVYPTVQVSGQQCRGRFSIARFHSARAFHQQPAFCLPLAARIGRCKLGSKSYPWTMRGPKIFLFRKLHFCPLLKRGIDRITNSL